MHDVPAAKMASPKATHTSQLDWTAVEHYNQAWNRALANTAVGTGCCVGVPNHREDTPNTCQHSACTALHSCVLAHSLVRFLVRSCVFRE